MFSSTKGIGGVQIEEHKEGEKEFYNKIVEMLLAAGYFRVRISTLTEFDKVVGGLCWCISNSNVDVDVDVSFQEDANIGQKIKVSEKIIRALKRMSCPVKIQSFQIQGLDYAVIYQVLQWLIKKVFETRTENQERIQRYSELIFSRKYELPQDTEETDKVKKLAPIIASVKGAYQPDRKFRKKNTQGYSEWGLVQSVLLEYGREFQKIEKNKSESEDTEKENIKNKLEKQVGGKKSGKQQDTDEEEVDDEEAERRIQELKKGLVEQDFGDTVSSQGLSMIVGLGSDDIQRNYQEYAEKAKNLQEQIQEGGQSEEMLHKRRVAGLKRQIEAQKKLFIPMKQEHDELAEKTKTLQEELSKYKDFNDKVNAKIEELNAEIKKAGMTREDELALAKLQRLIQLNESLKVQEQEFRQSCKKQLQELKDMISSLQNFEQNSEELQTYTQVKKAIDADKDKLKQIKSIQSKKNREISVLQRKIDEIPTKTELSQYERRFTELYDQVGSKLDENRKYVAIYNSLHETFVLLERELTIVNSIYEYFKKAKTKEYKNWMIETVKKNVEVLEKSKTASEKKVTDERSKRDQLGTKASDLVTKQRNYFRAVKEFQEECKKNEELKRRLKAMQQQ